MPRLALTLALVFLAGPAMAHVGHHHGEGGSFLSGLGHPLGGLDHVLAMTAVGLWAAMIGGKARWLLPAAFVGVMAAGFVAAYAGMPLPFVEPGIAASVIVLGLLVAAAASLPLVASAALVGLFALFHGHAHGMEMAGAEALPYAAGFVLATALLHGVGLLMGLRLEARGGRILARGLGGAAAIAGIVILVG